MKKELSEIADGLSKVGLPLSKKMREMEKKSCRDHHDKQIFCQKNKLF